MNCGCGIRTAGAAGNVDAGTAVCPCCGHRQKLIEEAATTGGSPNFHLFAVEVIPSGSERRFTGEDRRIRTATSFDRKMFADAEAALASLKAEMPDAIAPSPIPREGRKDERLFKYGYKNYSDLFSARQQLHLALLAKEIEKLEGPVREAFSIAFSDDLVTNNMLCGYATDWRRLSPLFSIRAFRHIALTDPHEPTRAGAVRPVQDRPQGACDLRCGDAKDLSHLPDGSIDLVLTDPPYFDYISYSELGHFFVPWLVRFGLVSPDALTAFPAEQMAAESRSPAAVEQFTEGMAKTFKGKHLTADV